jgi:DNA polymerase (family 10)
MTMQNEEIIEALELTGKLMELHNENPFKSKAYGAAAYKLSKLRFDFQNKTADDLKSIDGVGSGMLARIQDLMTYGSMQELDQLLDKTPQGLIEVMQVKGLGPKKVRQLWLDLQIESVGELLYACNENRLLTLKGFGEKTQLQIRQNIEFMLASRNKFHYASVEQAAFDFVSTIQQQHKGQVQLVGEMARKCEIIESIAILISEPVEADLSLISNQLPLPVNFYYCKQEVFGARSIELSSTPAHLAEIGFSDLPASTGMKEETVYEALGMQFIPPELREGRGESAIARKYALPQLISMSDLKGVLHNHTTDSDGVHTLKEMSDHCRELGYQYLGICDHSRSAFYANGLDEERVLAQHRAIEQLNAGYTDFRVLKGIESDILSDGSLDYPEEILKQFDFIVASVHSNLKMTEEKATHRLIKAIENPYTSILGHPTGRLLLGRAGYPIDHKKVIDACAANKVHMELNAHPYRLDIDWRWIPYCLEKGVKISINPDAHHKDGFADMYYGTCIARKGMLSAEQCLNALSLDKLLLNFKK